MIQILQGDCRVKMAELKPASVQCCVTSPPYWGLRSYLPKGHADKSLEIGQEPTPEAYVEAMLQVFGGKYNPVGIWRLLADDGTLWLNLGDCFNSGNSGGLGGSTLQGGQDNQAKSNRHGKPKVSGLKHKDLVGIPWLVAFALQRAGWYLRSDIIWHKKNCMTESVTDRPTRSHEYIFLLSKQEKYFYDHEAIKEPCIYGLNGKGTATRKERASANLKSHPNGERNGIRQDKQRGHSRKHSGFNARWDAMSHEEQCTGMRNKRDVWTVAPAQFPESHFATFPEQLIRPCILAGSRRGDTVIDPFGGSGTTGQVALQTGRKVILIELHKEYFPFIKRRTQVQPELI